jgi:hypothetical protein
MSTVRPMPQPVKVARRLFGGSLSRLRFTRPLGTHPLVKVQFPSICGFCGTGVDDNRGRTRGRIRVRREAHCQGVRHGLLTTLQRAFAALSSNCTWTAACVLHWRCARLFLPPPSPRADVRLVPNQTKSGLVVDRRGSSHFRLTLGNGLLYFRTALKDLGCDYTRYRFKTVPRARDRSSATRTHLELAGTAVTHSCSVRARGPRGSLRTS